MTTALALPKVISDAMADVANPDVPFEDRAALYALLYEIKRRIDRSLGTYVRKGPSAKSELTEHLVREGGELGPLFITWDAFDVEWPVNDEGNWGDAGTQEQLAVYSLIAPEYVKHVPDHFEIDTAALGEAVHMGDPVARRLHAECKDRKWRTEGGRRAALKVREVRQPKKEAA
jgi:hypothetical protein